MEAPKPYRDEGNIRTFDEDVFEKELIWHRDLQDREITVLEGKGWQLQLEDEYPNVMQVGKTYSITKLVYHRIIKGDNKLVLKIK